MARKGGWVTLVVVVVAFAVTLGILGRRGSSGPESLEGRWVGTYRIDGVELLTSIVMVDGDHAIYFDGCNSMGYLFVRRGDEVRFSVGPDASSTSVGCIVATLELPDAVSIRWDDPPYFEIPSSSGPIRFTRTQE